MATQTGILQALWAEVRPAVEARDPSAAQALARLVNRGKCGEALSEWRRVLDSPAVREAEALHWIARRASLSVTVGTPEDRAGLREAILERAISAQAHSLMNCRLLLDDPLPDRVWLRRHGAWILYLWKGERFEGLRLEHARRLADADAARQVDLLLLLSVNGRLLANPKLPPP